VCNVSGNNIFTLNSIQGILLTMICSLQVFGQVWWRESEDGNGNTNTTKKLLFSHFVTQTMDTSLM